MENTIANLNFEARRENIHYSKPYPVVWLPFHLSIYSQTIQLTFLQHTKNISDFRFSFKVSLFLHFFIIIVSWLMDEFECLRDWDLEAIVRGSSGEATAMDDPNPDFSYFFSDQDELLDSFPEFSETTRVLDDLEDLYKPFYPVLHPLSPHTIVTTSIEPQQVKELKASEEKVALQGFKAPPTPKCKKGKKNQNKSVVKQVTTAEGLDDAWAWRKYGQKPIKGSPYPRSYYRCSSSKGCLARKQVERSHLDPAVFLVTYTAEHSHPHPTRRNSLAGTTRKNNSLIPPPTTTRNHNTTTCSSRTPLMVQSIEDKLVTSVQQSMDLKKEEQHFVEWFDDGAQFGDAWIPTSDLEKFIGFECQHFALDGAFTDAYAHS